MANLRKIAALGVVLAAAVLLFAVVCPFTTTPTAVVTARHTVPAHSIAFGWTSSVPALLTLSFIVVMSSWQGNAERSKPPLTVLSRTCVHLC